MDFFAWGFGERAGRWFEVKNVYLGLARPLPYSRVAVYRFGVNEYKEYLGYPGAKGAEVI
jgi:hypothetical protein